MVNFRTSLSEVVDQGLAHFLCQRERQRRTRLVLYQLGTTFAPADIIEA